MLTDVDLPAPGLLWPRWVTLAASLTGIGWSDVWYVDDEGAHYDDHGGTSQRQSRANQLGRSAVSGAMAAAR